MERKKERLNKKKMNETSRWRDEKSQREKIQIKMKPKRNVLKNSI